jgi:Rad3-related DNA helicase
MSSEILKIESTKKSILDYWPHPEKQIRRVQEDSLLWMEKQDAKYIILEAPVGCHSPGTNILMYDGTLKLVEDIVVGDILMGPDSLPRTVLNLFSGKDNMFNIEPLKGNTFQVNGHHILSLVRTKLGKYTPSSTGNEIINISVNDYINKSKTFKYTHKLYRSNRITFSNIHNILQIPPYIMGLFLGDGHLSGTPSVCTTDIEIVNELQQYALSENLMLKCRNLSYFLTTGSRGGDISTRAINPVMQKIKQYNLNDTRSGNKFIPIEYKTSSIIDRLEILAGIIDTDGHVCQETNMSATITSKSIQLANDIAFISRSLGFAAYITSFVNKRYSTTYYNVSIIGDLHELPTRLPRKKFKSRSKNKNPLRTQFNVTSTGIGDYYGFELDMDHLYLLEDFTVTHNSGKSLIGMTYSRYLAGNDRGDSFILTPQRILQAQYETEFKQNHVIPLYGKSNYPCASKSVTCDIGALVAPGCGDSCAHKLARKLAASHPNVVLNYTLALLSFSFTSTFKPRKLMIMDECHTAEKHLVNFDAVAIYEGRCKKIDIKYTRHTNIEQAHNWCKETYIPALATYVAALERTCEEISESRNLSNNDIQKLREFESVSAHYDEVQDLVSWPIDHIINAFVLVHDKTQFQFKRLHGAFSFKNVLVPKADRFLLMSSTILSKDGFCSDLGIDQKEAAFLSMESEFPVENRPVYFDAKMKMNASWSNDENKPHRNTYIKSIKKILEDHKEESGIIHTSSFAVSEWLIKELAGVSHNLYHHNPNSGDDRNAVIKAFCNSPKPGILISPSITEGLDLKDDIARFAIFAKVPFPYLGDQWIKRRMEMSGSWYARQTLIDIIQGGGRVVRTPTDHGVVYILDGSFGFLYSQNFHMIPRWWKEAYKRVT